MKRFFAIVMAMLLAFSLVACDKGTGYDSFTRKAATEAAKTTEDGKQPEETTGSAETTGESEFLGVIIGSSNLDEGNPYMEDDVVYADLEALAGYFGDVTAVDVDDTVGWVSAGAVQYVFSVGSTSVTKMEGESSSAETLNAAPKKTADGMDVPVSGFVALFGYSSQMKNGRLVVSK